MAKKSSPMTVVCFGEALWDVLPKGIFLGGAPLNVAYHLQRQGMRALLVTAVGRDFLGGEVLRRMGSWKLDTSGVAQLRHKRTGHVLAMLDRAGAATYEITREVAWDHIPAPTLPKRKPAAIVYGTLAMRSASNRKSLDALLARWPDAMRVADLNFRAPFDTVRATAFALDRADLVKLNEEELGRLHGAVVRGSRAIEGAARQLSDDTGIARICVTAGSRGAGLWWDGQWSWEAAKPVEVKDTVGAGDSFLAALLSGLLQGAAPDAALRRACRVGEFVASQDGATPAYTMARDGLPRRA